jgi:hypothetical protein
VVWGVRDIGLAAVAGSAFPANELPGYVEILCGLRAFALRATDDSATKDAVEVELDPPAGCRGRDGLPHVRKMCGQDTRKRRGRGGTRPSRFAFGACQTVWAEGIIEAVTFVGSMGLFEEARCVCAALRSSWRCG